MSRIGKLPIQIPAGVTVTFQDGVVAVKGPKGALSQSINPSINVSIENGAPTDRWSSGRRYSWTYRSDR